jgi:hypothetical protein
MVWGFSGANIPVSPLPQPPLFYFSALANIPTPDVSPMFPFPWRPPKYIIVTLPHEAIARVPGVFDNRTYFLRSVTVCMAATKGMTTKAK